MGLSSIIRAIGAGIIYLGIGMFVPFLYTLSLPSEEPSIWLFSAIITILSGVGFFTAAGGNRPATDFRGGILTVLLWWIIAPLFACLPLILKSYSFSDGYFESVSALTQLPLPRLLLSDRPFTALKLSKFLFQEGKMTVISGLYVMH